MNGVPALHIHITEREPDGSWENCTECSTVEWMRLVHDATIPATHAEAEALRKASGRAATGGSNLDDMAKAVKARYGYTLPARKSGYAALRASAKPGMVWVVQGSMRAFGPTDPLSKWDPFFDGGHAILLMCLRNGSLAWCDPEAPSTAAVPVPVTWAQVKAFMDAFAGAWIGGEWKDLTVGNDVSKYQTTTPPLRDFLIARATIGLPADPANPGGSKDAMYATHIAAAKAKGIVTGAYHFNDNRVGPKEQAKFFLATAGNVDLYALDVEGANAFTQAQAAEFIAEVHVAGKRIGLYHSLSGFFDAGQDWNWVAYWNVNPPSIRWDLWQYGSDPARSGTIDGDQYNGTLAQFKAWATEAVTPPDTSTGDSVELTKYLPGYTATIIAQSNVRVGPTIASAKVRTTTADETGSVVIGTVLGDADPADPTDKTWYAFWKNGKTEYTHQNNVKDVKAPVATDDGFTKATQDAAVAAQKAADTIALNAAVAAQKAADKVALDAANAAAAKSAAEATAAKAAAATAAATEKERIAIARGKAEADTIRHT